MSKAAEKPNQITLAECLVGMTVAAVLSWLVLRPTDLVVILVPPVLIYFAGEAWWARRGESSLGTSIKIALLSTLVSAPLTGLSALLHGPHEGILSTGVAAFLGATLLAAIFGLMPAFASLVIYHLARDAFLLLRGEMREVRRRSFPSKHDLRRVETNSLGEIVMSKIQSTFELLTHPHFQARPAMYAGRLDFPYFGGWLGGLMMGGRLGREEEPDEFEGFRKWLVMKLDGPSNTSWVGVVWHKYGDGQDTTQKCFELLNEFVADRAARGEEVIVREHDEFLRRRSESFLGEPD